MGNLSVDPQALSTFGLQTEDHGVTVQVESGKGQFDNAALGAVFGLIGSDFMAMASLVTTTHHQQVSDLGQRYSTLGHAVMTASRTFADTEQAAAESFGAEPDLNT